LTDETGAVEITIAPAGDVSETEPATETATETAVEIARIEADARVDIAEIDADVALAAINAAERAESELENDKWRDLRNQMNTLATELEAGRAMMETILELIRTRSPTAETPPPEMTAEMIAEIVPDQIPSGENPAGPRDGREDPDPAPRRKTHRFL
jgi:small-conductance mechanosensitive channel